MPKADSKLMGCLDAIWASVIGLESGILPNADNKLAFHKTAALEGKSVG
jgi:hypothetical protein